MTRYVLIVCLVIAAVSASCAPCPFRAAPSEPGPVHEDGAYRGVFIDGDVVQINVEIVLANDVVTEAGFRHLKRDEDYHLDTDREPYRSVVSQYQEALDYLVGKNLAEHLNDLYHPERIVSIEVDGYSAATLRSNKIISAIRDALNRGVYNY